MKKTAFVILALLAVVAIWLGPEYTRKVNHWAWTRVPPGYPPDWTGPRFRKWEGGVEVV